MQSTAARPGHLEERAHDLGELCADELEQAEVKQQRQQDGCNNEDDDEGGEQIVEHEAALIAAGDEAHKAGTLRAHTEVGQPHEDGGQHTDDDPDGAAGKAFLEDGAIHDELGLSQRNKAHDGGDRQDDDAQQGQEAADGAGDDVRDDLDDDRPITVRILDGDHEQDNADDRGDEEQSLQAASAFRGVIFHFLLSP